MFAFAICIQQYTLNGEKTSNWPQKRTRFSLQLTWSVHFRFFIRGVASREKPGTAFIQPGPIPGNILSVEHCLLKRQVH
jgi:hypothetical protein